MIDFYSFKSLDKFTQCQHAVSKKSLDAFYSLSLALHTGENAQSIVKNRNKIISSLGWKKNLDFVIANQTHSDHIVILEEKHSYGWDSLESAIADCDALITQQKGLVLSVLTADCVPILLFDKDKEVIAAVHAGWKGSKANIVSQTVQKMREVFGSNPQDIFAGIAPAIGACCYEVGEEVAKHFEAYQSACKPKGDKTMLDLPLINKEQLIKVGLLEENIEMSGLCTACEVDTFFSYRKEQGCTGRFMSMIVLV